ncbi:MAG: hypothetical protein ACYDBV_14215 [Nitrospiria bacterium]
MKNFKKMSSLVALYQFKQELEGMNLEQSVRVKFINAFKRAFERSEDFDLASSAVFRDIMEYVSRNDKKKSMFKSEWQRITKKNDFVKGVLSDFFGGSGGAVKQLKEYIDKELISGESEVSLTHALIDNASEFFQRGLSPKEIDIIRMHIVNEKVRLRELGKLQ